jgi:poly(A) polymerase
MAGMMQAPDDQAFAVASGAAGGLEWGTIQLGRHVFRPIAPIAWTTFNMTDLDYIEQWLLRTDPAGRERGFHEDATLRGLLPEVCRLEGVPQPPDYHPEGDALVHTLLAVRHLPPGADRRLAWAALLHDIGKARTTREVDGRIRAFGHDQEGAAMAAKLLERLRMPEPQRSDIVWLVRHHMFALSWQVSDHGNLSRRQRRFLADPRLPLLLDLMEVDARAAGGSPDKLAQVDFYRTACREMAEDKRLTH